MKQRRVRTKECGGLPNSRGGPILMYCQSKAVLFKTHLRRNRRRYTLDNVVNRHVVSHIIFVWNDAWKWFIKLTYVWKIANNLNDVNDNEIVFLVNNWSYLTSTPFFRFWLWFRCKLATPSGDLAVPNVMSCKLIINTVMLSIAPEKKRKLD